MSTLSPSDALPTLFSPALCSVLLGVLQLLPPKQEAHWQPLVFWVDLWVTVRELDPHHPIALHLLSCCVEHGLQVSQNAEGNGVISLRRAKASSGREVDLSKSLPGYSTCKGRRKLSLEVASHNPDSPPPPPQSTVRCFPAIFQLLISYLSSAQFLMGHQLVRSPV